MSQRVSDILLARHESRFRRNGRIHRGRSRQTHSRMKRFVRTIHRRKTQAYRRHGKRSGRSHRDYGGRSRSRRPIGHPMSRGILESKRRSLRETLRGKASGTPLKLRYPGRPRRHRIKMTLSRFKNGNLVENGQFGGIRRYYRWENYGKSRRKNDFWNRKSRYGSSGIGFLSYKTECAMRGKGCCRGKSGKNGPSPVWNISGNRPEKCRTR